MKSIFLYYLLINNFIKKVKAKRKGNRNKRLNSNKSNWSKKKKKNIWEWIEWKMKN